MARPKRPIITAQDVDDLGHLKAKMADLMRQYDEIKNRVPIWKRESYEHGPDQWVNCAKGSLA